MLTADVNGVSIAYERSGHGMPLVLIHGYPLDHTIWEPVASLLEKDFDLILPDVRGFGESQTTTVDFTMTDLAADVAGLLDFLGVEKAFVTGHSMGGYIALAFAHAYPRRMLALGLVASQPLADTPDQKASRYETARQVESAGVDEVAESMSVKLTRKAELQMALKKLILRQRPAGLAGALQAMAERPDSTAFLTSFDFPVMVVHGLDDRLVPVERARQVKAAVRMGTLVEIDGAGHMPMMEFPHITADALYAASVLHES